MTRPVGLVAGTTACAGTSAEVPPAATVRTQHSRLAYMRYPGVAITEPQPQLPSIPTQLPAVRRNGMRAQAS